MWECAKWTGVAYDRHQIKGNVTAVVRKFIIKLSILLFFKLLPVAFMCTNNTDMS